MDLKKFVDLLARKALFFTRSDELLDPYEGTIPEYNVRKKKEILPHSREGDKKYFFNLKTQILINSWHLGEYESAAMWQVYAKNDSGIAIQSTFDQLKKSFLRNHDDPIFIGVVNYLDYTEEWMDESNFFEAFITKRKSFESEKELRAITYLPLEILDQRSGPYDSKSFVRRYIKSTELTKQGKYVRTNLNTLVEKIYVAPKSEHYFKEAVESLVNKFALKKEVIKSDLYSLR